MVAIQGVSGLSKKFPFVNLDAFCHLWLLLYAVLKSIRDQQIAHFHSYN